VLGACCQGIPPIGSVPFYRLIKASMWVQIFNTTLTKDPKKVIQTFAPSLEYDSASFATVVDTAKYSIVACPKDRSEIRKSLESCLLIFNQYSQSIDILIQHQPYITALIWGSVRTLMQVRLELQQKLCAHY
jgi:hypothetical protein